MKSEFTSGYFESFFFICKNCFCGRDDHMLLVLLEREVWPVAWKRVCPFVCFGTFGAKSLAFGLWKVLDLYTQYGRALMTP